MTIRLPTLGQTLRKARATVPDYTLAERAPELLTTPLSPFAGIWFVDAGTPERLFAFPRQRERAFRIPELYCSDCYEDRVLPLVYETIGVNVATDGFRPEWLARLPEHAIVIIPRRQWHRWFTQTGCTESRIIALNSVGNYPPGVRLLTRDEYPFVQGSLPAVIHQPDPCLTFPFDKQYSLSRLEPRASR